MNNILLNSQHGLQSEKSLTITISSHARRENVFVGIRGMVKLFQQFAWGSIPHLMYIIVSRKFRRYDITMACIIQFILCRYFVREKAVTLIFG